MLFEHLKVDNVLDIVYKYKKSYVICTFKIGQPMQQPLTLWGAQKSKSSLLKISSKLLVVQFGCSHIIPHKEYGVGQQNAGSIHIFF